MWGSPMPSSPTRLTTPITHGLAGPFPMHVQPMRDRGARQLASLSEIFRAKAAIWGRPPTHPGQFRFGAPPLALLTDARRRVPRFSRLSTALVAGDLRKDFRGGA